MIMEEATIANVRVPVLWALRDLMMEGATIANFIQVLRGMIMEEATIANVRVPVL